MKDFFSNGSDKKRVVALSIVILGALFGIGVYSYVSVTVPRYPLSSKDSVSSWNFQSAYPAGSEDEKRIKSEIEHLQSILGKGTSDYEVYVGIASEYELLGEGKRSYLYLSKAIEISPNKALAYFSMGHLLERVGALYSAKQAYNTAVQKEPSNTLYTAYRDQFMAKYAEQAKAVQAK